MQLFRMEHREQNDGMWTVRVKGKPVVDHLQEQRLANMPMPYSERFRNGGKIWRCSVGSFMMLAQWFNRKDTEQMLDMGFHVVTFENREYVKEEYQILFNDAARQKQQVITNEFVRFVKDEITYDPILHDYIGQTVRAIAFDTDATERRGPLVLQDGAAYVDTVPVHPDSITLIEGV